MSGRQAEAAAEMELPSWDSELFRPPHCAGPRGAPEGKGQCFLMDVEDARRGEEVDVICGSAYAL